jgi:uncharacterized protein (TIGR02996 family)
MTDTISSTELACRRAIAEYPDDDEPRLIYATWLQDDADPPQLARAEFVRVQIEKAIIEAEREQSGKSRFRTKKIHDRWAYLRHQERRSFMRIGGPAHANIPEIGTAGVYGYDAQTLDWSMGGSIVGKFSRGFIGSLTLSAADFLQHADRLCWPPLTMPCPTCRDGASVSVLKSGVGYVCSLCSGSGRIALPRPTEACRKCNGKGGWETGSHSGDCPTCSGSGRVPRTFPPHAQPIRRVVLTTQLEQEASGDGRSIRFVGRNEWHEPSPYTGGRLDLIAWLLTAEWPWIHFSVPA